ncbi:MAG: NAD(P)H-dependent oxidoreductase subunit E [Lachnospiraceae bacterium]|nr:NAD(P)H-dependent oxidoreductase subunit E [Lachnospiraceae bacterium]
MKAVPSYIISICSGSICGRTDNDALLKACLEELSIPVREDGKSCDSYTSADGRFRVELTGCIGACHRYPVLMVNDELYTQMSEERIRKLLHKII